MKLSHLQEAQYAGDHPLVTEIKTAIAFNKPVDVAMDSEMAKAAVKGIVNSFGEPSQVHDEEGLNLVMVWDIPGNRIQVIIQGNRTVIEMFAFGENKKRESAPLMRRMQRRVGR